MAIDPREEQGRLYGVVVACRREDGRWLMIRRSATVPMPHRVCFPGGGIEPGETDAEAAVREMREELDLDVRLLERVWEFEHPDRALTLYGWIADLGPRPVIAEPAEVAEVLWLTQAEAATHPDNLPHTHRFVAAAGAAFGASEQDR